MPTGMAGLGGGDGKTNTYPANSSFKVGLLAGILHAIVKCQKRKGDA